MITLLDTCVIVDAIQEREPFAPMAQLIFKWCAQDKMIGCVTAKSLTDIYYLVRKCTHSDTDTRIVLQKLINLFAVLDTKGIDCRKAILSETSDYEDAVMIETAKRSAVDCIVTRNIKDFKDSEIPVYDPDTFCKVIMK